MNLGRQIRKIRQHRMMSQKALARLIGASATHIGQIETNTYLPTEKTLSAIEKYLGVDLRRYHDAATCGPMRYGMR